MEKAERLMDLLAMLLDTRRPVTAEQIRRAIPGYAASSEVAFRRMFERDKEELRDLGIPLERVATDVWESEEGYLVRKDLATLPAIDLDADELAALSLAAQAWEGQAGPGSPERALLKLSLAGGAASPEPRESAAPSWLHARVDASTPVLATLLDAIARRKRVTFAYRTRAGGEAAERAVEPHALRYRGSWYLAGLDRAREEVRHFKLDRIAGKVTVAGGRDGDFDAPEAPASDIPRGPWAVEGETDVSARVAFSPDTAWWVERRTGAQPAERADGWSEMTFPVGDRELFLSWILGFADDAEIVAPQDLRDEIAAHLRAAG